MSSIRAHLIEEIEDCASPVPAALQSELSPARYYLREWRDHWLDLPDVQVLRVGQEPVRPVRGSLFNLRFENHIGLTRLQPYANGVPLCRPVNLEVLSSKFASPSEHVGFFRSLLEDLYARAVRLPFHFRGPTGRGVKEALQPPTPLFTLHFLTRYAQRLQSALALVKASPHRCLADEVEQVGLPQASQADANVLQDIVRSPERWVSTNQDFVLARRLHGYAPLNVKQRLSVETLDTAENRFVHHFVLQLLVAAEQLVAQPWWHRVGTDRKAEIRAITDLMRRTYHHPMFDEVGDMHRLPLGSQVLLRRDGYRDLLDLWRRFHRARRPLFSRFRQAIEVRDIATLYEVWVFFALIDEIRMILGKGPQVELRTTASHGLAWNARARFGTEGSLVYNRGFRQPNSYSVSLRPDFSWLEDGSPEVVLDAKFRLERLPSQEEEDSPGATAKRADLYKMHAYRDALGVRAAVALYPGTENVLYDKRLGRASSIALHDLLTGNASGIGAIPMRPITEEA